MKPERYAPPRTEVADLMPADTLLAARPRSVVAAVALLALSLVVGIVSTLPMIDPPMADEPAAMTAMVWGITLAMVAIDLWLMRCIWQRRNWARWVMLALIALGLAATAVTLEEELSRAPWVAGLALASAALSVVAALLLLLGPSGRWFRGTR